MNLYCIKCSKFTNNDIKIKREKGGKINLSSYSLDSSFLKNETIDEEEVIY